MTAAITKADESGAIERALVGGDLRDLSPPQRIAHYFRTCESLGLNPWTKPFEYLALNGKLVLYAKRDATDQLRKIHGVSVNIVARERMEDVYVVTARATTADGRQDESTGVVTLGKLQGDNLANALMKAETKAKRRVTLSIVGLGILDESEVETVRGAQRVAFDVQTGEVEAPVQLPPKALPRKEPAPTQAEECPHTDALKGMMTAAPTREALSEVGTLMNRHRKTLKARGVIDELREHYDKRGVVLDEQEQPQ